MVGSHNGLRPRLAAAGASSLQLVESLGQQQVRHHSKQKHHLCSLVPIRLGITKARMQWRL